MHAATVVNCVGNITEMMYDQDDIKVTFTHQCGLTQTFFWPNRGNICSVPTENVLSVVDSCTVTGRNYTISNSVVTADEIPEKNFKRCRHKLKY